MRIRDSHALVTGAARGIGRAIAEQLVAEGAVVTLSDIDLAEVERTAAEIGGNVSTARLDVTDRAAFGQVVDRAEAESGPLDILVNNAGLGPIGLFHEQDPDLDERGLAVNLNGMLNGMRVVIPRMLGRDHGHIVNVSSGAAFLAVPGGALYGAAKAGVRSATECLRVEYGDTGIGFTGVYPGFIDTGIIAGTRPPKLFPPVAPEVLGKAVVRAIERGKPDVFVPGAMRLVALQGVLPRAAQRAINKAIGLHDAFVHPDEVARASYNERLRSS